MIVPMEVLTPASPSDLPPLGELVAEEPFRRYPSATMAGAGAAHLRVWLTTGAEPGHPGRRHRYGPSVVLFEHYLAPELGEGREILDLVRIGADGRSATFRSLGGPHYVRSPCVLKGEWW
jgi:hypothetical protein